MSTSLFLSGLRHSVRHPWQLGLAILGVALGVAVVVSIDLANASASRAFTLSAQAVAGAATHQLRSGPRGLSDASYRRLRSEAGIRLAAPVVQGYVSLADHPGRSFLLRGIDPFAEQAVRSYRRSFGQSDGSVLLSLLTRPGTLVVSVDTARTLGLTVGDGLSLNVNGRPRAAELAGIIEPGDQMERRSMDELLLTDIATAQELLGMVGRISHIDLLVADGVEGEDMLTRARRALPPGTRIVGVESRSHAMLQMTRAFRLNLTMLSLLALVVGMFLIYNTMTFSVVQRRAMLGTLRALGVTRAEVFSVVLLEAVLVGALGTLLGLALGIVLADLFLGLITRTINDLYFVLSVRELSIGALEVAKGAALGVGASAFAAAVPALEATRVPPRVALSRSSVESRVRGLVPRLAVAGALVTLASVALLLWPSRSLVVGFVCLFGIIIGFTLVAPGATAGVTRLLQRPMALLGGTLGPLAARSVGATLSRTAVAVAALMVAISATVGVGIMVDSFRSSVVDWLESTLQADVYVSPPSPGSNRSMAVLEPATIARLAATPGVAEMSTGRHVDIEADHGTTRLNVLQMAAASYAGFRLVEGRAEPVWKAFDEQQAVLISEPYAYRHALAPGSAVRLLTDSGNREFKVAGIFADYGSDQGVVLMSRATYDRYWDDRSVSAVGIYAEPGMDLDELVQRLRIRVAAGQSVLIRSNRGLREMSLAVFDRTFTITTVLRLLATLVAFVGVLSALMALQLERAREMAVLRASGLTGAQVLGLVSSQTGVMGLIAGLLAVPLGTALALVLVLVINRRSFGWTLQVHVDPWILLQALALAVLAAVLAGLYPAWRMARTSPALALRED
ncbi:MAG: ABC transporter permease [Gammaproteobacteria bacterium]|nr:ABC transporter permease [Gammaproteobacteria bacterium]